jgi:hypothetical protein
MIQLDDDYISQAVQVRMDNLDEEYARNAADIELVARHYAKSVADVEHAKINVDSVKALTRSEIRNNLFAETSKNVSEARLDHEVNADASVIQARQYQATAMQRKEYLKGLLKAVDKKGEMLISLGASQRQERKAANMAM